MEKLDCTGCHGALARGDGPTFVSQDVFNKVVFGGNPSEREERLKQFDEKVREVWNQKLDDWGNPIRPANLNRGVYKGGRRPLDLYWRISKGITGANMPPRPDSATTTRSGTWSISCWRFLTSPTCSRTPPCPRELKRPRPRSPIDDGRRRLSAVNQKTASVRPLALDLEAR